MTDPCYITTAISYPNGRPHIGHAYEAIAADSIARFYRLAGRDVRFQTGTDEHGLKMAQKARDLGISPKQLADEMSGYFREMCDRLCISYDRFIRTTEIDHHAASQALWQAMEAKGDLYRDKYQGWYSVRDEAFYDEKELIVGDDGLRVSPQGTQVEWTVEETWFFRLSRYQQPLLEHFAAHPNFIMPEGRRNEVIRFVESGLKDLSVSRTSFDWGVPVPSSPGHVMYVWLDALTCYISGLGYPQQTDLFSRYWPASLQLIGKDIVRFHAVYWPAFLLSAGVALPKQVFGHGFILHKGEKMSKSVGNVVDPMELADAFGVDQLRYFLLREVSFGQDGSYSEQAIVTRCNADLANNFGNLAQRTLTMIAKACGGIIPPLGELQAVDRAILTSIDTAHAQATRCIEALNLAGALEAIWSAMSLANSYFAEAAPWAVRKSNPQRADAILYTTAEAIRRLAIMASWAIPVGSSAILDLLNQPQSARSFAALHIPLAEGLELPEPHAVFPRLTAD